MRHFSAHLAFISFLGILHSIILKLQTRTVFITISTPFYSAIHSPITLEEREMSFWMSLTFRCFSSQERMARILLMWKVGGESTNTWNGNCNEGRAICCLKIESRTCWRKWELCGSITCRYYSGETHEVYIRTNLWFFFSKFVSIRYNINLSIILEEYGCFVFIL